MLLRTFAGAVIGGLSQDPLDNPFSAIVGAGIGGTTGFYFAYHKNNTPTGQVSSKLSYDVTKTFGRSTNDRAQRMARLRIGRINNIPNRLNKIREFLKKKSATDKRKDRLRLSSARLKDDLSYFRDNIRALSTARNIPIDNTDPANILRLLEGDSSGTIAALINDAAKMGHKQLDVSDLANEKITSSVFRTRITSSMNREDVTKALTKHFQQLGHSTEDATRKAGGLSYALHGFDFTLNNTSLTAKIDDKLLEMPLTAHAKDGFRFSKIGDTFYTSKAFNPFARLAMEGRYFEHEELSTMYGSKDPRNLLFTRFDPEEIIALYRMNHSPEESIRLANTFVRENIEYMQSEAHLGNQPIEDLLELTKRDITEHTRRASAQSIGFIKSLQRTKDNGYALRDIDTLGAVNNGEVHRSEYSAFFSYIGQSFNYDPFEGQSVNTIGRYTNKAMIPEFTSPLGLFPSADRGYDSQIFRSYTLRHKSIYSLTRLDVDEEMARWISTNLGLTLSIDDGAGIISENTASIISQSQYQNFEIHRGPSGKFAAYDKILKALNSNEKRKLLGEIKLRPNTVIGFDGDGKAIKMGHVYTEGAIEDAFVSEDKLHIRVKATFSGKDQSWLKLFGTSSKAGYSVASQADMRRITTKYALRYLSNDKEILQDASSTLKASSDDILSALRSVSEGRDTTQAQDDIADSILNGLKLRHVNMVAGMSETGNKFIPSMITGTAADMQSARIGLLKQITASNITQETKDMPIFAKHLAVLENVASPKLDLVKASMFMLAQTDFKGNADIISTLNMAAVNIKNQEAIDAISELSAEGSKIFYSDRQRAFELLDTAIGKTIRSPASLLIFKTAVQLDLGTGLHGIGNVGSMSWIERTQLKAYGFSDELLNKVSTLSHDAIYELELIKSLGRKGVQLDDAKKIQHGQQILGLFDLKPESRSALYKGIYGQDGEFVSHGLSLPEGYGGKIKSIPISSVSTNRTNIYEQEFGDILSSVDKLRREVIAMDIEYAAADQMKRKALTPRYVQLLNDLEKTTSALARGDGNIIKEASKRAMPGSGIARARSLGGKFADYINAQNINGFKQSSVAMSQQTIEDLARRSKTEIEFKNIEGQKFKKAYIRGTNNEFRVMLSREPAQGAYSVIFADVYTADGLDYYDVGIANEHRNIFKSGMFLDFDYDILKVAGMNFADTKDNEFIKSIMHAQAKTFNENEQLITALSRKGNKTTTVMHGSFNNLNEFIQHQMYSAMKSKQRKILAPHATDIAMNMTNALQRNLEAVEKDRIKLMQRSILGRTLIHNMTESLLKSAHRSSADLAKNGAISEIESMKAAYEKLAKGDSSTFEDDFRRAAASLFSLQGMDDSTKAIYNSAMEDVIGSAKNQAYGIESAGGRISDFRYVDSLDGLLNAIGKFQAAGQVPVEVGASDIVAESLYKTKGLYNHIRTNIMANKKPLILGGLGLAATALIIGADKPEMTKETLPYSTSDGILPPVQSQNAHVFKKKAYGQTTNIKANHHEQGASSSRIKRDTFGQNHGGRTNITIRDKRRSNY